MSDLESEIDLQLSKLVSNAKCRLDEITSQASLLIGEIEDMVKTITLLTSRIPVE